MIYLITRHPGALEWLRKNINAQVVRNLDHLDDVNIIRQGDTVIGTLPVNLVAEVCRRGARYLHLQINIPRELRGHELSAQQINELGGVLVEYIVHRPGVCDELL
ncbi:MAG: CRISPR-associated protein Csx16 [Alcaligenaceae bacterium]|nr:CRISPR-associated protein Csx16 [Alcaligenaceae bacterium]